MSSEKIHVCIDPAFAGLFLLKGLEESVGIHPQAAKSRSVRRFDADHDAVDLQPLQQPPHPSQWCDQKRVAIQHNERISERYRSRREAERPTRPQWLPFANRDHL